MTNARGAFNTSLALLTALVVASFAQTGKREQYPPRALDPPGCPDVNASCPDGMPGGSLTFKVNVSGGDPSVTPTFNWTVSAGTITSGQGTSSITVDTTGLSCSSSLTATVDVGGYDRSCVSSVSCSISVCCLPMSRKAGEYGKYLDEEKAQLSNLYDELRKDPTTQGYLVCYGGRRSRRGEARRRCERGRDYLGRTRGIVAERLVTVDGGFREEPTTDLWVVPSGATPPPASPTIDPSEVRPPAALRKARRRVRR